MSNQTKKLTLPLEAGKSYERRDGKKQTIDIVWPPGASLLFSAQGLLDRCNGTKEVVGWKLDGTYTELSNRHPFTIVADWVEPKPKTWRPWKPDEVPVGALTRNRGGKDAYKTLIVGVSELGDIKTAGNDIERGFYLQSPQMLLDHREYTTDIFGDPNTRAWHRCGVFE